MDTAIHGGDVVVAADLLEKQVGSLMVLVSSVRAKACRKVAAVSPA
jgi:hypothetical protein